MNIELNQKIVKGVALVFGMLGLIIISFTVMAIYNQVVNRDFFSVFFLSIGVLLGGAILWATYQIMFDYSIRSIKSFSAVLTIFFFGQIISYLEPLFKILRNSGDALSITISGLLPLIMLLVCYWILIYFFKKFTLDKNEK